MVSFSCSGFWCFDSEIMIRMNIEADDDTEDEDGYNGAQGEDGKILAGSWTMLHASQRARKRKRARDRPLSVHFYFVPQSQSSWLD